MGRRCRRCSEPATAAVKLAAAATVKQSAAIRQGGLRGSERVGIKRVRTATAADGSALRAVGAGGGNLSEMGPPRLQQQRYPEPGTGWGDGGGILYSNGPLWGGGFRLGGRVGEGRGDGEGVGARGREGYCKISLTETLWKKGNHTVVIWASLRGDGKAPPFDSVETMSMVTGGFIIGGEGPQQI